MAFRFLLLLWFAEARGPKTAAAQYGMAERTIVGVVNDMRRTPPKLALPSIRVGNRKSATKNSVRAKANSFRFNDARSRLGQTTPIGKQERRRHQRAHVPAAYSLAVVRPVSLRGPPLEGHVLDLSDTGMSVQLDIRIPVGRMVTVEFRIAGLGCVSDDQWSKMVVAANVVRQDGVKDFPGGPYRLALRFVQPSIEVREKIAQFVATRPN
jgi:hypothetical protein